MEIPFSTLRFRDGRNAITGINLFRRIIRTGELLYAPHIPLRFTSGAPNVSAARKYELRNIKGDKPLYIKPYATLNSDRRKLTEDFSTNSAAEIGGDVRYGFTDNLQANVSINTDFAQAETDKLQLKDLFNSHCLYPFLN